MYEFTSDVHQVSACSMHWCFAVWLELLLQNRSWVFEALRKQSRTLKVLISRNFDPIYMLILMYMFFRSSDWVIPIFFLWIFDLIQLNIIHMLIFLFIRTIPPLIFWLLMGLMCVMILSIFLCGLWYYLFIEVVAAVVKMLYFFSFKLLSCF